MQPNVQQAAACRPHPIMPAMVPPRPASPLLLLVLLLCAASAHGLAKEQAGRYTWHQQYVGAATLAASDSKPRARVYVATERNVLAALSPKDGSVVWRKAFADDDAVARLEAAGGRVFTLSGGGQFLRAFDAGEAAPGRMLWQAALGTASADGKPPATDIAPARPESGPALLLAAVGAEVQAFNAAKGRVVWSKALPVEASEHLATRLLVGEDQKTVWAVALHYSQQELRVVELSAASGEVLRQTSVVAPYRVNPQQLVLVPEGAVALSDAGGQLCSMALTGAAEMSCRPLQSLLPQGAAPEPTQLVQHAGRCPGQVVVQLRTGAAVLSLQGGRVALAKYAPGAVASGCMATPDQAAAVALATPSTRGLSLELVSAADGSTLQQATVAELAPKRVDGAPVPPAALWLLPFKHGKTGLRSLVSLQDHTLALLPSLGEEVAAGSAAAPLWLRHEALAGLADALLTDLPAPSPENEAAWQAAQPGLGESVRAQLLALKAQAMPLSPEEGAVLAAYEAATNDRLRPTRDPDGFRKQIVVATQAGKVAALHNGDGRMLWALDFGPAAAPQRLAVWRVPHDVQHDVEVATFHVGPNGAVTVSVINAHTGALVSSTAAPGAYADIIPLPTPVRVDPSDPSQASSSAADQHVFALVPADPSSSTPLHLVPDSGPARAAFAAAAANLSAWRVDREAGVVRGYGLGPGGLLEERWSAVVAPPGSGLAILEVAAHDAREAVQSHAKVLGNGSLKFKYLNPNTLFVAVGTPSGAQHAEGAEGEEHPLGVMLLDAVTGRVLASQQHEGARGPVHAVLCEHWAVYHFWNAGEHRWQMSVLELYDASQHDLRVLDLAFEETSLPISSWEVVPLEVLRASYFTKLPVTQLAVTRTARGVTARQILMSTPSGQVFMMDKRFLDPRRPIVPPGAKPTPEQVAEGLLPYSSELPMGTTMFVTADKQVRGLRGVATGPAALESTSLMFAHGLDLFYTRLAPSKTFDELPDDFPFALLVIIVVGMAGGCAALSVLNQRSALKKKWE